MDVQQTAPFDKSQVKRWTSRNRLLLFSALAILLMLPLLYVYAGSSPSSIQTTKGDATIYLAADRNRVLFPGQCLHVQWDVESIKAVALNTRGVVGNGTQEICPLFQPPTLNVTFQDDSTAQYQLPIERLYLNPIMIALGTALLVALGGVLYGLLGAPGLTGLLVIVAVGPLVSFLVNQYNDMVNHIQFAQKAAETGSFNALPPQFLFHVAVIGLTRVFPTLSFSNAGFIVVMAANVACAVAIYYFLRWLCGNPAPNLRNQLILALMAVGLMLIAPLYLLLDIIIPIKPSIPIWLVSYHSPTSTVLRPFAVLLFFFVVRGLVDESKNKPRYLIAIGFLSVAAVIAKPSYTLVFIPALLLFLVYYVSRGMTSRKRILLLGAVIVPSILVMIWQYQYLYGFQGAAAGFSAYERNGQHYQLVIAPFDYLVGYWGVAWWWLIPGFLLLFLFPISVYIAYYREVRHELSLNLAWLIALLGVAVVCLLTEDPGRSNGNTIWTGEITLFILMIVSAGFLLRQNAAFLFRGERWKWSWRFVLCTTLLVLHMMALVSLYVTYYPKYGF